MQHATFHSPLARWSRLLAVFSVQLVLAGVVLHRVMSLSTPVTLSVFLAGLAGAVLAVLLALASYVAIWRDGRAGAGSATVGLLLGLALMAWPATLVPFYRSLPEINDVSTDTATPPAFIIGATQRPRGANAAIYAGPEAARLQLEAYPDVRPMVVSRPITETWEVLGETIKKLGWRVLSETLPRGRGKPGTIEAVDRTLILGFYDDVVVRVDGDARETRIDVRSASRYGSHDFGRNAGRIKRLFKEFETRLEASVTGSDRPRRRRARQEAAVPKLPKGASAALKDQKTKQGRVPRGSQREPQSTSKQPARGADQGRGKQPAKSQQ